MDYQLFGLPGLYQNWLMAAVDKDSNLQTHGDRNFFCAKSKVNWLIKTDITEFPKDTTNLTVLNLYVDPQNMPWYMYNLFEKTYDIKVMVDNLVDDLLEKGHKFKVFEEFRTSLLKIEYRNIDDVIGLFYYYFQTQDHWLYKLLPYTQDNFINIEYNDFSHRDVLESKLEKFPGFDHDYFASAYHLLSSRNQRYLNRKQNFIKKFDTDRNFDIIETAYIGTLYSLVSNNEANWKDPRLRRAVLNSKQIEKIKDLVVSLC